MCIYDRGGCKSKTELFDLKNVNHWIITLKMFANRIECPGCATINIWFDLQSEDWINIYYMLKGFSKGTATSTLDHTKGN